LDQFLHVPTGYELIGCHVLGFLSDAGGNNRSFLKLLREGFSIDDEAWIDKKCVVIKHPLDPTQTFVIWFCMTHNRKSMRNALLSSTPDGT